MINTYTPASAAPSWDELRERLGTLREQIAVAEAAREARLAARLARLDLAVLVYVASCNALLYKLRRYLPPLRLLVCIPIYLITCSFLCIWMPSLLHESYQEYRERKRLAAAIAPLETPEAKEAAEWARREAEDELARQQQLVRCLVFIYRQLFAKSLFPLLVRIRLRLSTHPDRGACLLSLLAVCQLYADREGSVDHHFLPERHHPTFQGAACAVI